MSIQTKTDTELLNSLHDGDQDAFSALYNRYWLKLFLVSRQILEDDDLAKDVVQEAFVSFYLKITGDGNITNVNAYLYQAVKFQCFMHLRSGRISERHLQRINQVQASNVVEEEYEAQELQRLLENKIASLPERCREVFVLSRTESLTNQKIAERLNISTKTVEQQITKALKLIRGSIEKLAVLVFFIIC
jgi:RNA polymerase sigma-70 factor (family 1)